MRWMSGMEAHGKFIPSVKRAGAHLDTATGARGRPALRFSSILQARGASPDQDFLIAGEVPTQGLLNRQSRRSGAGAVVEIRGRNGVHIIHGDRICAPSEVGCRDSCITPTRNSTSALGPRPL